MNTISALGNTNVKLATMPERVFAMLLDSVLFGIVSGALYPFVHNPGTKGLLSTVVAAGLQWYFLTKHKGQTPGKMILDIRVVKTDGSALTNSNALVRYLGYLLNSVLLGIGWLWAFFDKDRQGLHDKLAGTYVVKANYLSSK
jgi:uncharacterized RDD family membrane protein YckC